MRHIPFIIVATLLLTTAVDVIAAGAKMDAARNHLYRAVPDISVALPTVELPQ